MTIDNGEDWTKPTFFGRGCAPSRSSARCDELESGDFARGRAHGQAVRLRRRRRHHRVPEHHAASARSRAAAPGTSCSAACARSRSRPSPRSTAPASAAGSSSRCTARRARSRPRCATSRCPEVFLGLFPAWGGTQLLPRLAGPETRDQGDRLEPAAAEPDADARRGRRARHRRPAARAGRVRRRVARVRARARRAARSSARTPDWSDAETIFRRARTSVDDTVHGAAPAPYAALDLIEGAQEWTLEEGYRREEEAIAELLPGPQAQASIYAFDLVERRAKRHPARPTAEPRKIEQGRHRRRGPDGARSSRRCSCAGSRSRSCIRDVDAGDRDGRARRHPRRDRRPGREGPLRRGQGSLPLVARLREHGATTASRTATSCSRPSSRSSR